MLCETLMAEDLKLVAQKISESLVANKVKVGILIAEYF